MKKLPIIGLLIGAAAAIYLKMKGKKDEPAAEPEAPGPAAAPAEDSPPPA